MSKIRKISYFVISSIFIALLAITIFLSANTTLYAQTSQKVDGVTLQINASLNDLIKKDDILSYSSSPYAIMENNESYKELVSLGVVAIKPLYDKINNSSESGLIEYIYAMAIEDIMSQNYVYKPVLDEKELKSLEAQGYSLTNLEYGWANSKEFAVAFKNFMNRIPTEYESIKNNGMLTNGEKIIKINELGLGVVPYLIEDIQNKTDLKVNYESALVSVLTEKNQIDTSENIKDSSTKKFDVNNWIATNYEEYSLLKKIAE